jgi:hypothetical protein
MSGLCNLSVWYIFYLMMSVSKVKKRKLEDESRVFQEKWENIYFYFFGVVRNKIVCLICNKGALYPNFSSTYYSVAKW